MKTILILLDSLNRHALKVYNEQSIVKTPNIDAFARESVCFDNHYIGSTPCMPARRDIFTGRTHFLERGWGPIEPFDLTLPDVLRERGVFSHLATDHYHYFELGGEGYAQMFDTWDFIRGQESDPWVSRVQKAPEVEHYGRWRAQYEANRSQFTSEERYPTPMTFRRACGWLEENKGADDFFLAIDCFSPHEPFDCPRRYLEMYQDTYTGKRYEWPEYAPVAEPPEALEHLRKRYAGTVSMVDTWFGVFMDTLKSLSLLEDTLILLTTDHGHLLGEHGFLAKNYMHQYDELAKIPLLMRFPRGAHAGQRVTALTQNIDLMPTILDSRSLPVSSEVQGKSLLPLVEGGKDRLRDAVLWGFFGMAVNICDGRHSYLRAPKPGNAPLFEYAAMPTTLKSYLGTRRPEDIELGRFLPYTNYPVYRIRAEKGGATRFVSDSLLFDTQRDPSQQKPLRDEAVEAEMVEKLKAEMDRAGCPAEQYERLGLR